MTTPTTVKEVLIAARDLISDPKRWTTGGIARDSEGNLVSWNRPEACCWCSLGALKKFGGEVNSPAYLTFKQVVGADCSVVEFNDSSPHEDVLAAFDIAICLES